MARNQDIQLLQETRTRLDLEVNGGKKLLVIGAGVLIASIVWVLVLEGHKNSLENDITRIDSELTTLEANRDKKFENDLITLDRQLSVISGLLDKHTYWSNVIVKMEKLLQDRVQITRIELKESSTVDLDGLAANYSTVAKQIAAFLTDSSVEDVGLRGVRANNAGLIEFTMQVKIKPQSLLRNEQQK